ncbi:hypothetical protein [Pantoea sp. CTOTU49201]|uniref:hypothetical protein n=1 Tax=Pantoea sp. CTOTU49201 TaxID=2953855 RepID=UPI0028A1B53F|nr:hypothetical protein [Pantoea sp. CTOTU49201]
MKYLIQTFIAKNGDGDLIKYEIYSKSRKLDYYDKVPEGSCRVISYQLSGDSISVLNEDVDVNGLFEANRPKPNTWYSDGPHRVNLEMLIEYLTKNT